MSLARNGNSLHYISEGKGPTVILIHGLGASHYDWESLRPALALAGYRALAVDLPGHGDSTKPPDPDFYTVDNFYQVLEKWIVELDAPPPYYLVAHSLGGYLSLRYAQRHPGNVLALALIDPFYSILQTSPILRYLSRKPDLGIRLLENVPNAWVERLLGWDPVSKETFSLDARLQIIIDIKRASPHILNIPRSLVDLTPELEAIKTPALVIWGKKDLTLRPASFPLLVSELPDAQGHMVRGSGHQPHIGKPQLVNQLVLDFIAAHAGGDYKSLCEN